MIYFIIGCVILAVLVFVFIITAVIGGTKGTNGKKGLWKRIKDFFKTEPHVSVEKPKGSGTRMYGNNDNKHEWTVKIKDTYKGKELSTGYFSKEDFVTKASDEREKHFEIGRGNGNLQVPKEKEYEGISEAHGYIRYDKENGKYVYWDISRNGTYKDCYDENNSIRYIEVSNGLKLYIAENVYIEFTEN